MIKEGDIITYRTVCDDLHTARVAYIYDGDKCGICSLYIKEINQYCDYPINEIIGGY